jgi:ribosome biogenesis GTPase
MDEGGSYLNELKALQKRLTINILEEKMNNNLKNYGLNDRFEQEASLYDGYLARVTEQHHHLYKIVTEQGELQAAVSASCFTARTARRISRVGDWVVADRTDGDTGNAVIRHILRRRSAFVRKAAGTANAEQIVAANIDMVFLCMSLNEDFNLRG